MKKTKLTAVGLAAIFALSVTPAQAGWQDTFDDIFPPIESPTMPEEREAEHMKLSGLSNFFKSAVENKGISYKGGKIVPDVSSKHLILRFNIPTNVE